MYPEKISHTYSIFPSPKVSDTVVEPINAVLTIAQLLENADRTVVLDNEAVFHISTTLMKVEQPNYADLNYARVLPGRPISVLVCINQMFHID